MVKPILRCAKKITEFFYPIFTHHSPNFHPIFTHHSDSFHPPITHDSPTFQAKTNGDPKLEVFKKAEKSPTIHPRFTHVSGKN
jgi:hypothetical protein